MSESAKFEKKRLERNDDDVESNLTREVNRTGLAFAFTGVMMCHHTTTSTHHLHTPPQHTPRPDSLSAFAKFVFTGRSQGQASQGQVLDVLALYSESSLSFVRSGLLGERQGVEGTCSSGWVCRLAALALRLDFLLVL